MKKTKPLTFLLALTFLFLFSCAANLNSTTVSSIAIAPVELGGSVHILLPNAMIESKKVREYLRNELNKLGFSKGEYDDSKFILTFLVKFLGSKKIITHLAHPYMVWPLILRRDCNLK